MSKEKALEWLNQDEDNNIYNFRKLLVDLKSNEIEELAKQATENENIRALEILIDYGANKNKIRDYALHIYPDRPGHLGMPQEDIRYAEVSELISGKISVPAALKTLDESLTEVALLKHIREASYKNLDALIADKTLLTFAAEQGHYEAVEALLEKGANPNEKDANGKTAIDHLLDREIEEAINNAAWLGVSTSKKAEECSALLRKHRGYSAEELAESSLKPAKYEALALFNEPQITDLYNFKKLAANEKLNSNDLDELAIKAIERHNLDALSILLDYGADKEKILKIAEDKYDAYEDGIAMYSISPEFEAIAGLVTNKENLKALPKALDGLKDEKLLEVIKRTSSQNIDTFVDGRTLLTIAAEQGNYDAVEALLKKGVNLNQLDASGKTALDYAENYEPTIDFHSNGSDVIKNPIYLLREHGGKTSAELASSPLFSPPVSIIPAATNKDFAAPTLPAANAPASPTLPASNAPASPTKVAIEEQGVRVDLRSEKVKGEVHFKHPDTADTIIIETGNKKNCYQFNPTDKAKEQGDHVTIEIPYFDEKGEKIPGKIETFVFDPSTDPMKIITHDIPENMESQLDQNWLGRNFVSLEREQEASQSMANVNIASKSKVIDIEELSVDIASVPIVPPAAALKPVLKSASPSPAAFKQHVRFENEGDNTDIESEVSDTEFDQESKKDKSTKPAPLKATKRKTAVDLFDDERENAFGSFASALGKVTSTLTSAFSSKADAVPEGEGASLVGRIGKLEMPPIRAASLRAEVPKPKEMSVMQILNGKEEALKKNKDGHFIDANNRVVIEVTPNNSQKFEVVGDGVYQIDIVRDSGEFLQRYQYV
jgi:ankyrin repeat protein